VAQFLMRPRADEIQFVNLVKRPSYNAINNNSVNGGFDYRGGAVDSRLDYAQMTMNFNQNLPQSIDEWPGFFTGQSVKPDWASFVTANKTKAGEIFFIAQLSKYDAVEDDLVSNSLVIGLPTTAGGGDRNVLIAGVIRNETGGISAVDGLDRISRVQVKDEGHATNGDLHYTVDDSNVNGGLSEVKWAMRLNQEAIDAMDDGTALTPENGSANGIYTHYEKEGDPNMFNYNAEAYLVGNNKNKDVFWFTSESYVINNAGSMQKGDDLVNSSLDPFSIFKNVAGESIMSIKKSVGASAGTFVGVNGDNTTNWGTMNTWTTNAAAKADISGDDYFAYSRNNVTTAGRGTNIDVVFIPDLLMAAVQRMLPALSKLKD